MNPPPRSAVREDRGGPLRPDKGQSCYHTRRCPCNRKPAGRREGPRPPGAPSAQKATPPGGMSSPGASKGLGGDLLSHPVTRAVPSALRGLTAVFGMGTGVSPSPWPPKTQQLHTSGPPPLRALRPHRVPRTCPLETQILGGQAARPFSTGQLNVSPRLHLRPINVVVSNGPSVRHSTEVECLKGDLILRPASRLDAFSGYPFRTWLPGGALGRTTGTPEVRPPRSSRTRGRPSQISCARSG